MKRLVLRPLFAFTLLLMCFFAIALPASAKTAEQGSKAEKERAVTVTTPDGKKTVVPMLWGCVKDRITIGASGITYECRQWDGGTDLGCPTQDLWLYWDGNQTGWYLCVRGVGRLNFDNSNISEWNNQVSSYWSGCSGGAFYPDLYVSTGGIGFSSYSKGNFPLGSIANDQLSAVYLSNNC